MWVRKKTQNNGKQKMARKGLEQKIIKKQRKKCKT